MSQTLFSMMGLQQLLINQSPYPHVAHVLVMDKVISK